MINQIQRLSQRYPMLKKCEPDIVGAFEILTEVFVADKRLYICGNGGSAADALHITGELVKSFSLERTLDGKFAAGLERESFGGLAEMLQGALPVFALVENAAFATAYANDCDVDYIFAQQVYAYAREGDCVLAISTSGNSRNVVLAVETARLRGAKTVALTGKGGGKLKELCDVSICVPETETYKVQELHIPVYHALCLMLEEYFWGEDGIWKRSY